MVTIETILGALKGTGEGPRIGAGWVTSGDGFIARWPAPLGVSAATMKDEAIKSLERAVAWFGSPQARYSDSVLEEVPSDDPLARSYRGDGWFSLIGRDFAPLLDGLVLGRVKPMVATARLGQWPVAGFDEAGQLVVVVAPRAA